MVLIATDLPEPVVPAISRCGIRARFATTGSPPMSLPSASGSACGAVAVGLGGEDLAQEHLLAQLVRQLDADHRAAGDGRDAAGQRRHRAGDVVGEADDAAGLEAGGGLELVHGDDRAGADRDDLAADAVVVEHVLEHPRRSPRARRSTGGGGRSSRGSAAATAAGCGRPPARRDRGRARAPPRSGRGRSSAPGAAAAAGRAARAGPSVAGVALEHGDVAVAGG